MLKLLRPLIKRQTEQFARRYDYDTAYLRKLFELSPRAFFRFRHVLANSDFAEDVPLSALYTVKFLSIMREDCGPCAQLTLDMAREAGVSVTDLGALVAREPERLGQDARLAWGYAQAVLDHSPEAVVWCDNVTAAWGPRALATLAMALVTARSIPAMKQALGLAPMSCQRLQVAS